MWTINPGDNEITIETMSELSQWIEANGDDENAMSHRIYKDTDCGAWLQFYKGGRTTIERPETWDVELLDSERGIVCTRGCSVTSEEFVTPDRFPYQLQIFLSLSRGDDGVYRVCVDDPDMQSVDQIPETDHAHRLDNTLWRVLFNTWQVTEEHDEPIGVRLGSIVEGADVETDVHTLVFPFTWADFKSAIACIEAEADDIWRATHDDEESESEEWETLDAYGHEPEED